LKKNSGSNRIPVISSSREYYDIPSPPTKEKEKVLIVNQHQLVKGATIICLALFLGLSLVGVLASCFKHDLPDLTPAEKIVFVAVPNGITIDDYLTEKNLLHLRWVYRHQSMPEELRSKKFSHVAVWDKPLSSFEFQKLLKLEETDFCSWGGKYYIFTDKPQEAAASIL
jgi:hypothetical protein